ncbi:MAG: choice-of-anchor I family protein [Saprospiraceae bacterium]|nr:choice-of-anchor I family protein [Saprospiraceae bacterium]
MAKRFTVLLIFTLASLALSAQTLVHYWNFNNSTDQTTLLAPTSNLVPGAAITHLMGGISAIQAASNTGNGFDVTNPNTRNGDASGAHLRFNDPIGGGLLFSLPTTGYQQVVVKFATRRSGSGAGNQLIYYTTNGTDFDSLTVLQPANGDPTLQTLDFSAIPAVNDNANFAIRITFEQGAGGAVGNNRFDNFTLDAFQLGADAFPPTVVFSPLDGTVDVAPNATPTITFSEDIRLVSDASITDSDIPTLIDLRLNDAVGAPVAFSGTYANRVITITPSTALANSQTYYLALNANVVEDTSNNAVAAVQSASFTTIAPQTQFQPGDLVPVAYRMNASGGQDEVAFLTFVNILPGTQIKLTDTKYTDNTQPQCPGGLTWTSPNTLISAGSVFVIQNDAGAASTGTVTGSTFGLSSGGDQVIVYTGTPAAPSYITALSSNAWVSSPHTACSGSLSLIPGTLQDGASAINLSTAPGNVNGNTVNGYYSGTQVGTTAELRAAILNPANWNGIGGATPPQAWPTWNFPGPPQVTSALVTSNSTIRLIFNNDLASASATDVANYTGIADLANVSVTSNGTALDTVTLTYATPFVLGNTYTLTVAGVIDSDNRVMLSPYEFTFNYVTKIKFNNRFVSVGENGGTATILLTVENPSPGATVDLAFKTGVFSTASSSDVTLAAATSLDLSSTTSISFQIPVTDDMEDEQDEYLVLALENANGVTVDGNPFYTVYIRDNDRTAPVASKSIELEFASRYAVPNPTGELGVAEIVAYDPGSKRLFTISTALKLFDIIDFSNPAAPALISQVDVSSYGGGITSIAVKNGIVAVCVPATTTEQDNGSVVFFDVNGVFQNSVTVGALPDMITFTPDGNYVLTANEGQPNDAYTIDPEGSVSIIDLTGGIAGLTQANVNTVTFNAFDSQAAALKAEGVRLLFAASTVSQDFEPEYITISPDSKTAWVTLQENNAIAELDLVSQSFTDIWAMGTKDYAAFGNGLDLSDQSGIVHIANFPLKGFYLPDGTANYSVGGTTYLVTANEGDEKEYAALTERTTVGAVTLDPTAFPNAQVIRENHNMGRFRITNLHGDTDGDGDFDELYSVGGRSFSIWNAETGALVFDSGDDFEKITQADPHTAPIFNADNEGNGFKGRSRAKGPEPEGVTVATIRGRTYAFITLERIGGVMVYDVTDPNDVQFVDYKNSRSNTAFAGDNGPEGVIFISGSDSPDGNMYAVSANEISGTLAIFKVKSVPTVSFLDDLVSLEEGDGDVSVDIVIENTGVAGSVTLSVAAASTAVAGDDYVLATTTIDIPANSTDTFSITLNLPDNGNLTGGKYLVLQIDSSSNAVLGSETEQIILIADNDIEAPAAQSAPLISLRHLTSVPGSPSGGSAEISAYDPASKRLFVTNIANNTLDVLNFTNPVAPVFLESVDVSSFGGGINSVAVKNGVVAVAVQGNTTADNGRVVFFDADGTFISAVTVGNLPDMVIFSNDGTKALTANEGEPSSDYSIDPLGSVSVINLTGGVANLTNANVTTLDFESFNSQIDALRTAGVRIFGPNATVGKDLEPEYICVSADDNTALVTLQENNALAVIDLQTLTVTSIEPLGYKDHSQVANILDASDRGGKIFSAAWPIKGAYMPDAIECFEVGGVTYAITANEGDAREWGTFVESQRLGSLDLDPTAFPNADYLQKNELLGRLNVLSYDGDTDGDGDLDEIYSFGGRSFTIWNLATGAAVWDSGDDLEAITAADPTWGSIFNASNTNPASFKNRSDDKGPEPEAVTIAEIEGKTFAFIGLERIGGVAVYEVTNPAAPEFIQYINTRSFGTGDLGPEGLIFIPKMKALTGATCSF